MTDSEFAVRLLEKVTHFHSAGKVFCWAKQREKLLHQCRKTIEESVLSDNEIRQNSSSNICSKKLCMQYIFLRQEQDARWSILKRERNFGGSSLLSHGRQWNGI